MTRTICTLALGLAASIGCGGGDGGSTQLSTGVDGTKQYGAVTADENQKICNATAAWVGTAFDAAKMKEFGCKLAGVVGGVFGGTAACQSAYDMCKNAAPPDGGAGMPMGATCNKPASTCTATVAELEACLNAIPANLDKLVNALPSCANVSAQSVQQLGNIQMLLGPACQTFEMKCPGGLQKLPGGISVSASAG